MKQSIGIKRLINLIFFDLKNIIRDSTLAPILFAPLLILLFARFAPPLTEIWLKKQFGFDLSPYFILINIFFAGLPSFLFGMMFGFLILEEKEAGIIEAISVSPGGKNGYLLYKLSAPTLLSFFFFILIFTGSALSHFKLAKVLTASAVSCLSAPLLALFLASFASNRVEGLALGKASGLILLGPFIAFFTAPPWVYTGLILPIFGPAAIINLSKNHLQTFLFFSAALVVNLGLLLLLLRIFQKRLQRY